MGVVARELEPRGDKRFQATHRRSVLLLVAGTLVINLAIIGALGWALWHSRAQYERSAETNVENISKVLEQYMFAQIREIDLTLQTVADEVLKMPSVLRSGNPQFASFLKTQASRIPTILGIRVADSLGNISYATGDVVYQNVNVGDREHFRSVRDDPDAGLVIGEPIVGRVSHSWVLILSRRLSLPDGSFYGEVHASIPLSGISQKFSTLDLGPHGVVSMWNTRTTLARFPEIVGEQSAIGVSKPSPQLKTLLEANTKSAIYRATAPTDNVQKTYSIKMVGEFPLWVIAGLAEQDYLKPWRNEVRGMVLIMLLISVTTTITASQIYRYWRERKQTEQRRREIPSMLIEAQEEERKRLASELHDSIGQTLAALKFRTEFILNTLKNGKNDDCLLATEEFIPILQRSIEETRAIYMGLRPKVLEDFGVVAALLWFRDETLRLYPERHIEMDINIEENQIPKHLGIPIFRIVQEALNNTSKHSRAEWIDVSLTRNGNGIELIVSDDGIGMNVDQILKNNSARSLGLAGMRERAEMFGGTLSIESHQGEGTAIHASWTIET